MATIKLELQLDLDPASVWMKVRDFGAVDRLFAGVVTHVRVEGRERVVTFGDGSELREVLVTCDDDARRLVYAAVGSEVATHHGAALEVLDGDGGTTRLTWITDVLPDALAGPVGERMRVGAAAMERVLVADDGR